MDDGTVVKPERSTVVDELAANRLGGRETLYKSRRGRYWLLRTSGRREEDYAEWISKRAAAEWLLAKGNPLGGRILKELGELGPSRRDFTPARLTETDTRT